MELAGQLRRHMSEGHVALGTFVVELRTPALARLLRQGGFDFMLVDTEHGCFDADVVARHIEAGRRWGVCPLVRVSGPERGEIMRALDAGAEGVMVPMCRSLEEVHRAVEYSKYPPLGQRGAHFMRPHTDYSTPQDLAAYMQEANRKGLTIVQIETPEAVDLIDQIAAVDGVDMLYLGPGDLSIALGRPGQVESEQVMEVAGRIGEACARHGKIAGSHFASPEVLPRLKNCGIRFVGFGAAIRMLQWGVGQLGERARKALAG